MNDDRKGRDNPLACGNIPVSLYAETGSKRLDLKCFAQKSDAKMMRREALLDEDYVGVEAATDQAGF
ncbi:hypothetical protein SJ05684_a40570 (plasmid) [Sinorhizobium sojae CCBAU 05684]|uniref:Uncharacterized protein n=1 Tax=Sinorhizobium sojae CCBAU 05684 TaxID=716928 RepID=A0A249PN67_9HYPH|nr:hypothetical protein SS05631_a45320 [Sinorhizobium sp. CCBAU 05631]ASY67370.1 hypothetical protein SJ05684_a40570 [Sinorhizobium sojae CCBAU 05684]ASY74042.1 hypothetical protein SF83666_a44540 [Sinorhizobium fredii CCBAU 83666]AWI62078.1 hypothetical protein AB395_00004554 [Sinorhizobium fredii CCBAU 45436]AWM30011.1 hypothetical protein AOX55_00004577 [Sinorhizobium fredii CCBAU 25509]